MSINFNKLIKTTVQTDHTQTKQFSYSKNKVGLNFSLRTDTKTELKDFLELLEQAQKEVKEELDKKI